MKNETLTIRFLYGTKAGRSILKLLVHPSISKLGGKVLETSLSRWIVPRFVKKHQIDLSEYEQRKYISFNDFFTRKRIKNVMKLDAKTLMSPCDGHLSVYSIDGNQNYHIKNVEYNIQTLLQDSELSKKYMGGLMSYFSFNTSRLS
ncbi:phosphatidylserine decarboxylase [Cellulosilyticum ruminicola]|uniref:phosphatidylserine decarboxylase n=1 Tax=Cellulosilyticum ruminicola TaxID=425254 RepID=UPI001FA8032C|nr:phosphatidylserine decarboxylase [Cellulosilyticum ruminicola]